MEEFKCTVCRDTGRLHQEIEGTYAHCTISVPCPYCNREEYERTVRRDFERKPKEVKS